MLSTTLIPQTNLWVQLATGLGLLFLTRLLWQIFLSPLSIFPGPILAKVTNLWRVAQVHGGHAELKHIELHRRHGSVVRIGPNCLSISDPDLIKTIYSSRGAWLKLKSELYKAADIVINGEPKTSAFGTRDVKWHGQIISPIRGIWRLDKLLEQETYVDNVINNLVDHLTRKYVDSSQVCQVEDWVTYFAWDTAASVSFGQEFGFINEQRDVYSFLEGTVSSMTYFSRVGPIPWIDNFLDKSPIIRLGPKLFNDGMAFTFDVITRYLSQRSESKYYNPTKPNPNQVPTILDKYYELRKTDPSIDVEKLYQWMLGPITAGGDTTAATLRGLVYYLSKTPNARKALMTELDDAALNITLTTPAQWKHIRHLAYLDAVIRESFRMNPGISLPLERVVPGTGFTFPGGRFAPGGTLVGANPYVILRDEGVFGDDVDSFRPERWLQRDGESTEDFNGRVRKMKETGEFVFGAGPRVCLGKNLVLLEISKLVATLYTLFDIQLVDPDHEWEYVNNWFVYQKDIPVVIRSRKGVTS